jgi:hypothetical protein
VDNRIATAPSRARSLLSLFSGVPITAAPNVAQIPLDEKQNQQSRRQFFSRRKEICIEKTRNQFHVYYGHDDPTHGGYLRRVQQQLSGRVGKEVLLISVSVDPINDVRPRMKPCLSRLNAKTGIDTISSDIESLYAATSRIPPGSGSAAGLRQRKQRLTTACRHLRSFRRLRRSVRHLHRSVRRTVHSFRHLRWSVHSFRHLRPSGRSLCWPRRNHGC